MGRERSVDSSDSNIATMKSMVSISSILEGMD